jgi:hypothetical protein
MTLRLRNMNLLKLFLIAIVSKKLNLKLKMDCL